MLMGILYCFIIISKLMTCFIDGFTSRMESQSIAYSLSEMHIYIGFWTLKVKCTRYARDLQECKDIVFLKVGQDGQQFSIGFKKFSTFFKGLAVAPIYIPLKSHWGRFNVLPFNLARNPTAQQSLGVNLACKLIGSIWTHVENICCFEGDKGRNRVDKMTSKVRYYRVFSTHSQHTSKLR